MCLVTFVKQGISEIRFINILSVSTFKFNNLLICFHHVWACSPIFKDQNVHFMSRYLPSCVAFWEAKGHQEASY